LLHPNFQIFNGNGATRQEKAACLSQSLYLSKTVEEDDKWNVFHSSCPQWTLRPQPQWPAAAWNLLCSSTAAAAAAAAAGAGGHGPHPKRNGCEPLWFGQH
jgi:hypothetical protein